jgi:hypothetical protein
VTSDQQLYNFLKDQLLPSSTIQYCQQTILECEYKWPELFEIMQEQPDNPALHWVKVCGKKFMYTQSIQDVLDYLTGVQSNERG